MKPSTQFLLVNYLILTLPMKDYPVLTGITLFVWACMSLTEMFLKKDE